MQPFGTISIDGEEAYFAEQNPLLEHNLQRTTVAPFGRPVTQNLADKAIAEYATTAAAAAFAEALKDRGATGIAIAVEFATFVTHKETGAGVPKWEIVFGDKRVNAGVLASILGNDPAYGGTIAAKTGKILEALGESWDESKRAEYLALTKALISAGKAVI